MMKSMRMVFCLCLLCLLAPSLTSAADDGWQRRLFGDELTDATGAKVPVARLEGKLVGLYFSAHWCPPCRRFTPRLVDFRDRLGKESPLEIVFVSCDRDARAPRCPGGPSPTPARAARRSWSASMSAAFPR